MAGTSQEINLCCEGEPVTPYNPKNGRRRRSGHSSFFDNITNPIPAETEDSVELKEFFRTWDFVPYAGNCQDSGHTLLKWYINIAKLSPTTGAAISKLNTYAFGSKAMFVRAEDPEYSLGVEAAPLSQAEAAAYLQSLKEYISFDSPISEFHRKIGWSYKATGNAWVEMSIAVKNGQARVNLRYHKPQRVLYKNTEAGEMRVAGISPKWDTNYLKKHPPRYVPMYPNYVQDTDGVLRTMFHLKSGDNDWYGRPDTEEVDLDKANEAQNSLYVVGQTGNRFSPRLIVEMEESEDPIIDDRQAQSEGFESFADKMEYNFSPKHGQAQDLFFATRPYGSRPMSVVQIQPNTNQDWYKVMGEVKSGAILRSFGLTPRFMGYDVSGGLSGADAFLTDYLANNEPTINEYRGTITDFTNQIISKAWEALQMPEMAYASITFASPIQKTVEEFKTRSANGNSNNPLGGNTVQPGGQ